MTESVHRASVLDSSALVSLLTDSSEIGEWVATTTKDTLLVTPHLATFEAANILRRQQLRGDIDATTATLAHQDLLALNLQLWPYALLADRAWELRENVTVYDTAYIALAELLEAPVITLDVRLERATGRRCSVLLPPTLATGD